MVFVLSFMVFTNTKISPRRIRRLIIASSCASLLPLCASAVFAAVVYGPLSQDYTRPTFDAIMNAQVSGGHILVLIMP